MYNLFLNVWSLLLEISPFLVQGFLFAGILSVVISKNFVQNNLGNKHGILSIIKASIFGVPLPLCSCSVIPVAASLKKNGASKGAVTSFLFSTPQTGIDSFMVTYGLLGPIVALVRPFIALISGILCGLIIYFFDPNYEKPTVDEEDSCCDNDNESKIKKIFTYSFITLPKDIMKPLLIGILIAALINIYLPASIVENFIGQGFISMIVMIVIGLPLYICATASIPIALAMMGKGVTLGAALVFLMVGAATNTTSIATMTKILGKRATVINLLSLILISLFFGMIVDLLSITIPNLGHIHIHEHTSYINFISTFIIIGLAGNTLLNSIKSSSNNHNENQNVVHLKIGGMSCNNCVQKITSDLESMGASNINIDLKSGDATFNLDKDLHKIKSSIESLGFQILS